ncbi:hypothetical protein RZE82_03535 [Mollicutes bacterium LVI A0039]|nr:hypothetical protein RZE82_03535 [Mollicutes bacterium LVI A0039]
MNKKTLKRIENVVEEISDFESISAQKLAELSFTSPSTISRFVRLQGYRNFIEYKLAIQQEKKINNKDVSTGLFDYWYRRISSSFELLENGINRAASMLSKRKIHVWCRREYDSIAKDFTFLLSRNGYATVNIDDYFRIENLVPGQDIVLMIGESPSHLYRKDIEYVSIVYNDFTEKTYQKNVEYLKIMPVKYQKHETLGMNYRITCIQLLLGMICEQVCLNTQDTLDK